MWPMAASQFLKTRVSPDIKHRVQHAASQQLITESIWLRRAVMTAITSLAASSPDRVLTQHANEGSRARLYVRLPLEDRILLCDRAAARGMPSSTYVSVLVRSHLRSLPPLPKEELLALKRSVAELGAIGRSLNQIVRAPNRGAETNLPGREDLRAMLRVAEGLREHVKALLKANQISWLQGHAEDGSGNESSPQVQIGGAQLIVPTQYRLSLAA
jgi:hypothetical protein